MGADRTAEAWNPRCDELRGIGAKDAIGRHIDDLLDGFGCWRSRSIIEMVTGVVRSTLTGPA